MRRQQATRRRTVRIDGIYIAIFLMVVSAIAVAAVGWFVLQAFLGMANYIETVIP